MPGTIISLHICLLSVFLLSPIISRQLYNQSTFWVASGFQIGVGVSNRWRYLQCVWAASNTVSVRPHVPTSPSSWRHVFPFRRSPSRPHTHISGSHTPQHKMHTPIFTHTTTTIRPAHRRPSPAEKSSSQSARRLVLCSTLQHCKVPPASTHRSQTTPTGPTERRPPVYQDDPSPPVARSLFCLRCRP